MAILENQYGEINQYARHIAQMILGWYTFFFTSNLVAIGLFLQAATSACQGHGWYSVLIFILVLALNVLGIFTLCEVEYYFVREHHRVCELLQKTKADSEPGHGVLHGSPMPLKFYREALRLMKISLIVTLFAWIIALFIIDK